MNMFMKRITLLSLVALCALTPMQARAGFWTKHFVVAAVGITAYFCLKTAWNFINQKKTVVFTIIHKTIEGTQVTNKDKNFSLSSIDLGLKISEFKQQGYEVTKLADTSNGYKAFEAIKIVKQNSIQMSPQEPTKSKNSQIARFHKQDEQNVGNSTTNHDNPVEVDNYVNQLDINTKDSLLSSIIKSLNRNGLEGYRLPTQKPMPKDKHPEDKSELQQKFDELEAKKKKNKDTSGESQ